MFAFSWRNFDRVGRDPVKGPVFPRYEPPKGYSPAAVHQIYFRTLSSHKALIATLMNLAVRGHLTIEAGKKKETTLVRTPSAEQPDQLTREDLKLRDALFRNANVKTFGKTYDASFTSAYNAFQRSVSNLYGSKYFKWNIGYSIIALLLSAGSVALAISQATQWSWWHTGVLVSLAGLNVWFMYLMPAPTRGGQDVRTEIEGFKLYMEMAEKLQLNTVVGSEAAPPMTTRWYERFLPYAVALGVEKPWTKYFERLMPEAAAAYSPGWTNMSPALSGNIGEMTSGMVSSMSSGVSSASPQSSGSSGSGGGGSSGGGGGGGGGW